MNLSLLIIMSVLFHVDIMELSGLASDEDMLWVPSQRQDVK